MLSNIGCGCVRNKILVRYVCHLTAIASNQGIFGRNNNNRIGIRMDSELFRSRTVSTHVHKLKYISTPTQLPVMLQKRSASDENKKVLTL